MLPVFFLLGSVRATPVAPLTTCPDGWLGPYTDLGCILFPNTTKGVSWDDSLGADQGCGGYRRVEVPATESGGAYTATQAQLLYTIVVGWNSVVTPKIAKYLWIGLSDTANEGEWKWTSGNVSHIEAFSSFFQPTTNTANNCVVMDWDSGALKWEDKPCSSATYSRIGPPGAGADPDATAIGAICQCLTDEDCYGIHVPCEAGWQDSPVLGCVKPMLKTGTGEDWKTAQAACVTANANAHMVEPNSQEKETAVEELAKLYFGFGDTYRQVWLGLKEVTTAAGSWIWDGNGDDEGNAVTYKKWKDGKVPADLAKQCAVLKSEDGTTWNWVDEDCDATHNIYICQMSEPDSAPAAPCTDPWWEADKTNHTGKGCFKINFGQETEDSGAATCGALAPEDESAYLAEPTDADLGKELAEYAEFFATLGIVSDWWLGLEYDGAAWRWVSGCDLGDYTNWKGGTPPADPTTNGCTVLTKDSTDWVWEAKPCTDATPRSMCQKPYEEEDLCITATPDPGATTTTAGGGGEGCPALTGTLDAATRSVDSMTGDAAVVAACGANYCCDQEREGHVPADWEGPGWYKFAGEFSKMADYVVAVHHCGTVHPGYMIGSHPSEGEGNVTRTVVWGTCGYTSTIQVLNCSGTYLYNLPEAPICFLGYCGVN